MCGPLHGCKSSELLEQVVQSRTGCPSLQKFKARLYGTLGNLVLLINLLMKYIIFISILQHKITVKLVRWIFQKLVYSSTICIFGSLARLSLFNFCSKYRWKLLSSECHLLWGVPEADFSHWLQNVKMFACYQSGFFAIFFHRGIMDKPVHHLISEGHSLQSIRDGLMEAGLIWQR